jgi:hypothetical protein
MPSDCCVLLHIFEHCYGAERVAEQLMFLHLYKYIPGHAVAYLVEALCSELEGPGLIPDEVIVFLQFT